MLDAKLRDFLFNVMMFLVFYEVCRWNTAYFPKLKFNKYIVIKNRIVAKILIPKAIGRDKVVDRCDYNKLPVIGLISLIIGMPINLLNLLISFMKLLNYNGINNLGNVVFVILVILALINMFVAVINIWDCGRR